MNEFILTFDIDWAPDFIIDHIASRLREKRLSATWFATHRAAALDRLRERPDLFELGIHPNFLPGSTHGNTPAEVLAHMTEIVPEAVSVRTHGLAQSGPILAAIMSAGLKADLSLFLPGMPGIRPVKFWSGGAPLLRIPYFWSDDHEMEKPAPSWSLSSLSAVEGLKVINFHPVHLYLNAGDMKPYAALKRQCPRLIELSAEAAEPYVRRGEGVQTFFEELTDHLATKGGSRCARDVYADGAEL